MIQILIVGVGQFSGSVSDFLVGTNQDYNTEMAESTLESLASKIYANALKLASIAKENGVTPSLDDPVKSDLTSVTPLALRNELIQAAKDLIYLSMGPADHVLSLAWSVS